MHTSIVTILAAGSFYSLSCSAAPQPQTTGAISFVVGQLDSNGQIDWWPAENGGRTATIPADLVSSAQPGSTKRVVVRHGPSADVDGFTNIGQIAGNAASYACEKNGAYGVSSTIESLATDACSTFLKSVPGAPVAEKAWNVWQSPSKPGASGNQIVTTFRWFYNSASAPSLTDTVCSTVYQQLTSVFCQGKGDQGTDTRGGEIKIGTGDDYLMIGLDPNGA